MKSKQVETTFYIQLQPRFYRYTPEVQSISAAGLTKRRPKASRYPVVKITLRLPAAAFLPLAPDVTIEVPEEAIDFTPTVTVVIPEVES